MPVIRQDIGRLEAEDVTGLHVQMAQCLTSHDKADSVPAAKGRKLEYEISLRWMHEGESAAHMGNARSPMYSLQMQAIGWMMFG